MATTDQRSGFRLPWSSDRSHDQQPVDEPVAEGDASEVDAVEPEGGNVAWPSTDFNARLGLTSQPRPADASDTADAGAEDATTATMATTATTPASATTEDAPMLDQEARAIARPAPKKPSKLMADLSAAIRATAESAREQALSQVDADVAKVVEEIRAGSKEGEEALKVKSDEDISAIRDWSRAEIVRIKEETESKIGARKATLAAEMEAHAAAIEGRVAEVEGTADGYRAQMATYTARLTDEDDPALLATLAESMPDAPSLEALADLGSLEWAVAEPEPEAEAVLEVEEAAEPVATIEPEAAVEAPAEVVETEAAEPVGEAVVGFVEGDFSDGSENGTEPEAVAEPETVQAVGELAATEADPEAAPTTAESESTSPWGEPAPGGPWGEESTSWRAESTAVAVDDDTPRWSAGETPEGFPTGEEGGDPVDRGAIMAALEAAAEAVVAAESAAESAGQAEAAADVAETAAELLKDRVHADESDPEAMAAMAARVDAGGVEESYTDRLAKLLPAHPEDTAGSEPRTSQVIVSGLVSVASIASFKRHLGRISGVKGVTVASGPDGEFVFNVNHAADVSFREALPALPGFAARVTSTADGVVQVTARDPEAEG